MPSSKSDNDFEIHIDPSCLNTPMDEEIPSPTGNVDKTSRASRKTHDTFSDDEDVYPPTSTESPDPMTKDNDLRPSIEADDEEHSMLSERTDLSFGPDDGEQPYVNHSESDAKGASHTSYTSPRVEDDENSSHHGGTDEDVFTDKSPRSSMGSYDAGSESGKGVDIDNMTTITRSPRVSGVSGISGISQYDKEDFIPTVRGTPRPPFRTPSDVRAMQMSSPNGSVVGSPRSSKKHFPTVSRLGTPSASAQYSPKRKSTPPRFKTRQEAPLVLLHVTLLPLRWMWGDLINNLDPIEMNDQIKALRNSWRILQDRVGDTVIERGILLGHPQNDYEVLEERLLEALDLPVRRRARILECGHYLGPSNATTLTEEEEESEDEYSKHRRQPGSNRHWCSECKSEIKFDSLGVKVFRVKVYASNGLMRAGAWEACWKEMERVDVELEPIVEPVVQDEIVRLAAMQQEREIQQQQEEADIVKEVEMQYEEQRRSEEELRRKQAQAEFPSPPPPEPEAAHEADHEPSRESRSSRRRQRDEERLREIYGDTPPSPQSHTRERSPQPRDSYAPPPSPKPSPEQPSERREDRRGGYQSASLPELLMQSARVVIQDRKNLVIVTLSLFVLILSLRSTPMEPPYEPIVHRMNTMPRMSVVNNPPEVQEQQHSLEARVVEPIEATPSFEVVRSEPSQSSPIYHEESNDEPFEIDSPIFNYEEASSSVEQPPVISAASEESQPAQETFTAPTSISTVYGPCENPAGTLLSANSQAAPADSDVPVVQDDVQISTQEIVEEIETITEKKVVKVYETVTETQFHTQTQTETQAEPETATTTETVQVEATEIPVPEAAPTLGCIMPNSQDATDVAEDRAVDNEATENEPVLEAVPEPEPEPTVEAVVEATAEPTAELTVEATVVSTVESVVECITARVAEPTVESESDPVEV
ncbi:hypothetical protein ANO14919_045840 [Xylariales sp. No.14919]|nr:hypothetical protein ANO14919_045840 [Xylariales sp. No.14919]